MWDRTLSAGIMLNGKYRIEKVIGEGNFGITYLCSNTLSNAKMAVKEYYPVHLVKRDMTGNSNSVMVLSNQFMAAYSKGLKRFVREAKAISTAANMGGIVAVRDIFCENNTAYMAMDYVEGVKLSQYLGRNRIGVDACMKMFMPVISALEMVHKQGVLHRDINPDNFIITPDNRLILVDFGAARLMDINDEQKLAYALKSGFAPVEQYCGQSPQGPWTDIYSLCATMLCSLSGIVPEPATSRITADVLADKIDGLNLPDDIGKVLKKGLSTEADKRFESMEELYGYLYEGKHSTNLVKILIAVIAALVIVLAIVGGLLGYKAIKDRNEEEEVEVETETDMEFMNEDSNENVENEEVTDENGEAPVGMVKELRAVFTKENKDEQIEKELCDDFDGDGSYEMYIVAIKKAAASSDDEVILDKKDKNDDKEDAGDKKGKDDKKDKAEKDDKVASTEDSDNKDDLKKKDTTPTEEIETGDSDDEIVNSDDITDEEKDTEIQDEEEVSEPYTIWYITEKKCEKMGQINADPGNKSLVKSLSTMEFENVKLPYIVCEFQNITGGYVQNMGTYICYGEAGKIIILDDLYIENIDGKPYAMVKSDDKCTMRIEAQHTMPYLAYPLAYEDEKLIEVASVKCEEAVLESLTNWEEKKAEIENRLMERSIEGLYWPDNLKPQNVELREVFYNDNGHIYLNYTVRCTVYSDDGATSGCELEAEADLTLMENAIREYHCYGGKRVAQGVLGLEGKAVESSIEGLFDKKEQ